MLSLPVPLEPPVSKVQLACILKYLVKGVIPRREDQQELQSELQDLLPHCAAVTVLPVVEGYSVEIEMTDLRPFNRTSFEPYMAEHILPEAVTIRCRPHGAIQLQLLKSHFN